MQVRKAIPNVYAWSGWVAIREASAFRPRIIWHPYRVGLLAPLPRLCRPVATHATAPPLSNDDRSATLESIADAISSTLNDIRPYSTSTISLTDYWLSVKADSLHL